LVGFTDDFTPTVQGIVTITAEANDNTGISKIEFIIDDTLVFRDTSLPYEYEWHTSEYSNCKIYTIKVVAYDNSLNSTAVEYSVFVENQNLSEINVRTWHTDLGLDHRLEQLNDRYFGASCSSPTALEVNISTNEIYQEIEGFGASLTNSSAWLIDNSTRRDEIIEKLFSPDSGIGISYIRLAMGSSDFVEGSHYSYAETLDDMDLSDFSIDRDRENIIPVLQDILAINPDLKIMGSPWSAPGWMKTSGQFVCGGYGSLKKEMYAVYADYFVKFIEEYALEGIPIDAITIQNEPLYCPWNYPGMIMSGEEQRDFVKYHLGPKFEENGIDTKIVIFDHNWDGTWDDGSPQTGAFDFIEAVYDDPLAVSYIDGTAFHGYDTGNASFQSEIYNLNPNKSIYFTERTNITDWSDWAGVLGHIAKYYFIDVLRYWSKNVLLWNLALDTDNGPYNGGCPNCTGVVTVEGDYFEKEIDYYIIGHFSKFVQQSSNRIYSNTFEGELETVAFQNPDGSLVVVTLNPGWNTVSYKINWNDMYFNHSLSPQSMATFVWEP
jgi:glucosylceramidase